MGKLAFISLTVLLSTASLLIASDSRSQDLQKIRVSVRFSQARLEEVLNALEHQSGLRFTYPSAMKNRGPVSLNLPESNMQEALQQLASGLHLRFSRTDGLIAVSPSQVQAPQQVTGTLRGRVVDFETSMPLPGATVVLQPGNKGMVTDEKGYYQFAALPAATYQLKATFIGYQDHIQTVKITEKELVTDIKLRASANLNTVVIKGRQGFSRSPVSYTSDKELLSEIRNARGVISGISNEQIVKSADRNAAEIVRRIPGITVVDDKFVVVRGMNSRYNITYLNDNIAPSTEVYNRSFAYDMLPTPVIDKILVFKSPSADMMGDYSGGAVKVFTKNTRPVRHFDVGVQLGFREGTTFKDLNATRHSSTDWLGFDDGLRKTPNLPTYRESGGKYQVSQADMISQFTGDWTYDKQQALPDMQVFLNYFDNVGLGKWRLFNLTSITYTNENRHFIQERQTGNTYTYMLDKFSYNLGSSNTLGTNDQSSQLAKINLLQNFTLRIDTLNRIEWKNFVLNEGRNSVGVQINSQNVHPDKAAFNNYTEKKQNTLQFQQRMLYNGNLGGYHTFRNRLKQELHWNLGYSYSLQNVPDQRVSRFTRNYAPGGLTSAEDADLRWEVDYGVTQNYLFYGMMNRFFVKNTENTYNGSADYSIQVTPKLLLKAGTYHLFRNRTVDRRFFKVNRGGLTGNEASLVFTPGGWDGNGKVDPKLLTFREQDLANIWQAANFREDGSGLKLYDGSTPIDRYVASEQNNSGYVQGEWSGFNDKLTVHAGARFEHHVQQVSGAVTGMGEIFLPVHVNLTQDKLLPSVQLNYRPDNKWVVRSSYGRTVNRPELREIAPFSDFDFVNQERITGNVLTVGSVIDNYDLRAEFYPGSTGNETISAGVFLKEIDKPIERLRFANGNEDYTGSTGITFFNSDKATVYGIEVELRKNLGFLPGDLFRKMSVVLNGAWIESNASRKQWPVIDNPNIVQQPGQNAGLFSGRPLQGQAPYVLNGGLYYENPSSGTKLGVLYNVSGPSIYALADGNADEILALRAKTDGYENHEYVTLATSPDLLELPRHLLDISLTQRIYKSLQVRLNVQNLLDAPVHIVEDQNFNHRYDKERQVPAEQQADRAAGRYYFQGDNTFLKYRTGRYCTLTFTYSF
ncbi:TonB-dependent receptor [Chitinophaga barathri]|nr:TonB-dependent receptor [Chitinophaga barathri]